MSKTVNHFTRLTLLAGACALASVAGAADEQTGQTDTSTEQEVYQTDVTSDGTTGSTTEVSIGRSANVESKLSAEFAEFLGGEENAAGVVGSLRTGQGFSWNGGEQEPPTDGSGGETAATTETTVPVDASGALPTGTMGYGNVRITLKLAEAQLEQMGITEPTSEQLSAVLLGGEIDGVSLEGILNERAAGAGWGEIAQRYGFKVGDLMGNGRRRVESTAADDSQVAGDDGGASTETAEAVAGGSAAGARLAGGNGKALGPQRSTDTSGKLRSGGAGKVTGGSQRHANGYIPSGGSSSAVRANGYIPSGGHGKGGGILTAGGARVGSVAGSSAGSSGLAKGHVKTGGGSVAASGSGIVSAGNANAVAAASSAGGNGLAKGHAKGKP